MTLSLMLNDSVLDRFWSKVDFLSSSTGCWLWIAATVRSNHGDERYGVFNTNGMFDEATIISEKHTG
jgi:hypothetical protein